MNVHRYDMRVLTQTLDRMKQKEHLPQDLVWLTGKVAALQLEDNDPISLDLTNLEPFFLPMDKGHARRAADRIIDLILGRSSQVPSAMARAVEQIKSGLDSGNLDFETALDEVVRGVGPVIEHWQQQTPDASQTLTFILLSSLEPSFRAGRQAIAEQKGLDENETHENATCPICGRPPYILEIRGTQGARFAVCSLCRYEYRIRRLGCSSCNSGEQGEGRFFTVEPEPGFRVETCDLCKTYIKTIDFRELDWDAFPLLNDLESLALDFLAQDQGYVRMGTSVWGI